MLRTIIKALDNILIFTMLILIKSLTLAIPIAIVILLAVWLLNL